MKALKYLIFLMLLGTQAFGQIVIVNPGNPPANPPIEPPGPRNPIIIRPDPTRPGGGDFDGKFYEYCGPSYLGYKCNFMRTEAVARMRDESTSYAQRNLDHYEKTLNAESAKVDNDLQAIRSGLDLTNSPAGAKIKGKLEQAGKYKASASAIDDSTLNFKKTAVQENTATIDVSFGLAFRDKDKTDYHGEANRVNLVVADRFVKSRITRELDRTDAIETQIRNGAFDKKEDRLALVGGGRAALEISAQSLKEGDTGKSHFALQVGTVLLDTAISFTPILGWGKDTYEAVLGKNLLTGEKLSGFERSMAVVGVFTAGIGSKLAIAGKASVLVGIIKRANGADEAADLAVAAGKAEKLFDSAKEIGWGVDELKTLTKSASEIKRFGPLERGILHDIPTPSGGSVADTFRSSSYFEVVSKEPVKMYRVYGGNAGELAPYWSRTKPTGPLQAQLDAALLPDFRNTAAKWVEIEVPAGTKFFDGAASPQYLQAHGSNMPVGQLLGGGNQVYIPRVDRGWITGGGAF